MRKGYFYKEKKELVGILTWFKYIWNYLGLMYQKKKNLKKSDVYPIQNILSYC